MYQSDITAARSTFPHGTDFRVRFHKRNDSRNSDFFIDVWHVENDVSDYYLSVMIRKESMLSGQLWVFGSIYDSSSLSRRAEVWSFSSWSRKMVPQFKGDVFTAIGEDGLTYVMFKPRHDGKVRRQLLSQFLQALKPFATQETKSGEQAGTASVTVAEPVASEVLPDLEIATNKVIVDTPVPTVATVETVLNPPQPEVVQEVSVPSVAVRRSRSKVADDLSPMEWFVRNVLSNMCGGVSV